MECLLQTYQGKESATRKSCEGSFHRLIWRCTSCCTADGGQFMLAKLLTNKIRADIYMQGKYSIINNSSSSSSSISSGK